MRAHTRFSCLLTSGLAVGCVGGSSATGATDSSGTGGSGPAGCIKVDCSVDANESKAECDLFSPEPGSIGDGPPFLGNSPDVRRGFLEGTAVYVAFRGDDDGSLFAIDVESGARTFLSGVLEDPQTGPQPRGEGPSVGTPWDVARAPDGRLYALVDNEDGRQVLYVDETSGDRALAVNLAANPCTVGAEMVQLDPQFEVLPNGDLLMFGGGNGGGRLFQIAVGTGACTVLSFASDDANQLGSGPRFYDYQSLVLNDGKAYVSDEASLSLVEIDLTTGARVRVSSSATATPVGEGPTAGTQSILASGGKIFAARDSFSISAVLVETDLSSGNRTERLSMGGPIANPSAPWLYGERDGCFYLGARDTLYAYDPATGLSYRVSR